MHKSYFAKTYLNPEIFEVKMFHWNQVQACSLPLNFQRRFFLKSAIHSSYNDGITIKNKIFRKHASLFFRF